MIKVNEFLKNAEIRRPSNSVKNPEISVILPTFCRGDNGLLKRAVDSVLNQTFANFELIVVDDGSADNTRNLMTDYLSLDGRVVYIRNDIHSGLPALRVNQGILNARGKYIAYQFDDDWWYANALETLYNEIAKHRHDCMVYGKTLWINKKTNSQIYLGAKIGYHELITHNRIANNSVLHPKSLCYKYGTYDCHVIMRRPCDWDLWLRWMQKIPFIFVDETVSVAEASHDHSIGADCIWDSHSFRIRYSADRTELLKLDNIKELYVDDLEYINDESYKNRLLHEQILPWLEGAAGVIRSDITVPENKVRKKYILVTKTHYDACISIMFSNFIRLSGDRYRMVFIPEWELSANNLKNIDIAVFCKTFEDKSGEFLELCKKEGIPVIYAMDEDLINAYKSSNPYSFLIPGTPYHNNMCNQLSKADLVMACTPHIARSVFCLNSKVVEIGANIPKKYFKKYGWRKAGNAFKIAFLSGNIPKAESDFICDVLLEISDEYGDSVEFHFWGHKPKQADSIKKSRVFAEDFAASYDIYIDRLSESSFDLLLCPLFDDDFRRGKSPMKFLEAAVCGAAGLYSDVPSYHMVVDGVTGFKVKNEKDLWKKKIREIIGMKDCERSEIVENAIDFIEKNHTTEILFEKFRAMIERLAPYGPESQCGAIEKTDALKTIESKMLIPSKPIKKKIIYDVLPEDDYFSRIGLLFKTYSARCDGVLKLRILDAKNKLLAETGIDLRDISCDCRHAFDIAPVMNCRNKVLRFQFIFDYGSHADPVSVYENNAGRGVLYKYKNHIKKTGVLYVELS